jgi:hypothetical protein
MLEKAPSLIPLMSEPTKTTIPLMMLPMKPIQNSILMITGVIILSKLKNLLNFNITSQKFPNNKFDVNYNPNIITK